MSLDAYDSLFQQFPAVSAEEWKNKIIKDLKGASMDKLIWSSPDDIDVLPFYTKEDNEQYRLDIPDKMQDGWQVCERISVTDCKTANEAALHALQQGATSVVFNLHFKNYAVEDIEMLLNSILLDIAPVYFEHYTEEDKQYLQLKAPESCPHFVIVPQQFSMIDELVFALDHGTKFTDTMPLFRFYTSQHYFFEIAKLRAFRWLWKQVGQLTNQQQTVFIQSETSLWRRDDEHEYNNMLRNTTEAMSAVLGGCDSLIINSHDIEKGDTAFGKRIARNIHFVLQHEAYFTAIKNAADGSYFIEYLTYQMAEKAWERFRNA